MAIVEIDHHPPNLISNAYLECVLNPVPRNYLPGQFIYSPADPAESFYLLTEGRVELSRQHPDGQNVIYATLQGETDQPNFFGEEAFAGLRFYHSTAQAIADVNVRRFASPSRGDFLRYHPQAKLAIESFCRREIGNTDFILSLAFEPLRVRLSRLLVQLGQPADQPDQLEVFGVTQYRLAERIGATRESVNKHLNWLRKAGYIDYKHGRVRRIIIFNMPSFEAEVINVR